MEQNFILAYCKLISLLICHLGRVVSFLPITNITHRTINTQWSITHQICSGGAQVNVLNESTILIALCAKEGPLLGSIDTLPIVDVASVPTKRYTNNFSRIIPEQLTTSFLTGFEEQNKLSMGIQLTRYLVPLQPLLVDITPVQGSTLYGNSTDQISGSSPASVSGYNTSTRFKYAHHMYQTTDGETIYFVDNFSCLKEINRTSGYVKTLIGECNNSTLGWTSLLAARERWRYVYRGVSAMTYYERAKTWIFCIKRNGLFAYIYNKESSAYVGRRLTRMEWTTAGFTNSYLLIRGDIIWYKHERDINKLYVDHFFEEGTKGLNKSDGSFEVRLSASIPPTERAVHTPGTNESNIQESFSSLDIIDTDPYTIAINSYYSIDFYNPVRGNISVLCSNKSAVSCELNGINEIVWLNKTRLLGFDAEESKIEEFVWPETPTTTASTPETSTPRVSTPEKSTTTASTLEKSTTTASTLEKSTTTASSGSTVARNVATRHMMNLSKVTKMCALLQFGFLWNF